jgi:transposase
MPRKRKILGEISGNAKRRRELTPWERAKIVSKREEGLSFKKISRRTGTPKTTCIDTVHKHNNSTQGISAPRSGRPKILDPRLERRIVRFIHTAPDASYREIQTRIGLTCSKATIYRILKDHGLTNWRKRKRPALTKANARERLLFCRRYRRWRSRGWKRVIWSDECSAERGKGKKPEWVFRTPRQKWDKEMIQPVKKGKDVSVMVWAAFSGALWRSELIVMERDPHARKGGYSSRSYLAVLQDQIVRVWEPGLIFMQDNAPIHKAGIITQFLREMGVKVLKWPPYSPDLNPIEHLWFVLKQMVYTVRPDIDKIVGKEEITQVLGQALKEAWELIPERRFEVLWRKYHKRIDAVLKAKGWWTKY